MAASALKSCGVFRFVNCLAFDGYFEAPQLPIIVKNLDGVRKCSRSSNVILRVNHAAGVRVYFKRNLLKKFRAAPDVSSGSRETDDPSRTIRIVNEDIRDGVFAAHHGAFQSMDAGFEPEAGFSGCRLAVRTIAEEEKAPEQ